MNTTDIHVATCPDVPSGAGTHVRAVCGYVYGSNYRVVGYDPEPADLAILPVGYVYQKLRPNLVAYPLPAVSGNSFA